MAFLIIVASQPGGLRECLVLGEGQRQHEIEVREIDETRGIVKLLNRGQEQTLDFTESGDARIPICGDPVSGDIDPVPSNPLTAEEQTILIEARRLKALQDGDPIAKILPPTDFTPEIMGISN